jgi:hypothetical protein
MTELAAGAISITDGALSSLRKPLLPSLASSRRHCRRRCSADSAGSPAMPMEWGSILPLDRADCGPEVLDGLTLAVAMQQFRQTMCHECS